jgi:hypothetical protein
VTANFTPDEQVVVDGDTFDFPVTRAVLARAISGVADDVTRQRILNALDASMESDEPAILRLPGRDADVILERVAEIEREAE